MNETRVEGRPWTELELARLYQSKLNYLTNAVIGEQLGRTSLAIEHKWKDRAKWIHLFEHTESLIPSRQTLKDTIVGKLNSQLDTRLELSRMRTDVLADRLADCVKALPRAVPAVYKSNGKKKMKGSDEDAGLILSDLHIGLKYDLEETGGISEYSVDVFKRRLNNLQKAVTDITELHNNLYRMPTINLFMLGDNTQGMMDVGAWSAAYIDISIIDQVMEGVHHLTNFVYYLLGLYENVTIHALSGNHGRCSQKGKEKDYVNWDYVIYQFLLTRFADNPRVTIVAPKAWYIYTTIRNHRFLLLHGEDVRGGTMPIASLLKVQHKLEGILGSIPHYTLAGHFHSAAKVSTNNGRIYINGAFTGPDPHSLKSLQLGGKPEQIFFGIHDVRGITWEYNIDLDSPRD